MLRMFPAVRAMSCVSGSMHSCEDGTTDEDTVSWDNEGKPLVESTQMPAPGAATRLSDEAEPSRLCLISHFVAMGFAEHLVDRAIKDNDEGDENAILQTLLNYSPLKSMDWTTDEDICSRDSVGKLTVESTCMPACGAVIRPSDEAGPSRPSLIPYFVAMGFTEHLVDKAIKNNEEGDENAILQTILNYGDLERNSLGSPILCFSDSPDLDADFSDTEEFGEAQVPGDDFPRRDEKLAALVEMGFPIDAASSAIERCGEDASILELTDFICTAHVAEETDANPPISPLTSPNEVESRFVDSYIGKKRRKLEEKRKHTIIPSPEWEDKLSMGRRVLPNPMVGFGLPGERSTLRERELPEMAKGPPFFYYENVALTPTGVWEKISSHLYEIKPEYLDSKFFCACARKRGYIHNLPIKNRFLLTPIPPKMIWEALPWAETWRPKWDQRTHLNCLQTSTAGAKLLERIQSELAKYNDLPPTDVQKYVLHELKKWNLVWVGRHKVAPLEPDEMEKLLGFPKHHTRGISRTERYKSLGNSFQIDTVAYHLSVLKDMFPDGIRVLSLFSGIGGAEVALHRLGIPMKVVVSVELSPSSRNVLRSWWEQTCQSGTLIHLDDVQQVNLEKLEELCNRFGGFDLVIGGSPCNNLAGRNRLTRDGLEGEHSSLFFDYSRILDQVKGIMRRNM